MPKMSIRAGVFETNSSSLHAVVIRKDVDPWIFLQGVEVGFGKFEDWYELLLSPVERLSYLWTLIHDYDDDPDYWDDWEIRLNKVIWNQGSIGVKFNREFFNYRHERRGSVEDAYQKGDLLERLYNDNDLLTRFIYGDSYVVTYDNKDEFMIPHRLMKSHEDDHEFIYVK